MPFTFKPAVEAEIDRCSTRLRNVRRVLKAIDPNHPALVDVGFSPEKWTRINLPQETAVASRLAKPLDNPDAIAAQAQALLASQDWSDMAAGVTVATGGRSAEVLQTARFEMGLSLVHVV